MLEFKSTLRWNVRAGRRDEKMEHEVLKTVVAFLNSEGGCLLVGVGDDGSIQGTDLDEFPNDDKYLLHFTNLLRSRVGAAISTLVRYDLRPAEGKKVLVVQCGRSPEPVYLKSGSDQEFYIRTGPSSVKLSFPEFHEYVKTRFGG